MSAAAAANGGEATSPEALGFGEEHASLLLLLKESEDTLVGELAGAVQEATAAKALTPAAVHAIGERLLNTPGVNSVRTPVYSTLV